MTNNKQQMAVDAAELAMKLYPFSNSERNAFINGYNKAKEIECVLLCAKEQRSIELPSDEEIDEKAFQVPYDNTKDFYDLQFIKGAKWMRDKIQGGDQ